MVEESKPIVKESKIDVVATKEQPQKKKSPMSADAHQWIALHYRLRRWITAVLTDSSKYKYLNSKILTAFDAIGQLHVSDNDHQDVLRLIQK